VLVCASCSAFVFSLALHFTLACLFKCLTVCHGSFVAALDDTVQAACLCFSPAQPSPAQPSPAQPSPAQPSPAHTFTVCSSLHSFQPYIRHLPQQTNQPLQRQTTHQLQRQATHQLHSRHSTASCHRLSPCCWYAGCTVCRKAARLAGLHSQQQRDSEVVVAAYGWPPTEQAVCSCGQAKH